MTPTVVSCFRKNMRTCDLLKDYLSFIKLQVGTIKISLAFSKIAQNQLACTG